MGCCCSCLGSPEELDYYAQPQPARDSSQRTSTGRAGQSANTNTSHCAICGMYVHPSLIDSHQEVCRMLQRQAASRQQTQSSGGSVPRPSSAHFDPDALKKRLPTTDEDAVVNPDDYPIEALCVICLERLRCYAFLPCGHVVCCRDCAARCDRCPICREERGGLCFVPPNTVSQYQCTRCNCFIAPAIFDGHREVCAMRMRQARQERQQQQQQQNEAAQARLRARQDKEDIEAARAFGPVDVGAAETLGNNKLTEPPVITDVTDSEEAETAATIAAATAVGQPTGAGDHAQQWHGERMSHPSNSPLSPAASAPAAAAAGPVTMAHRPVVQMNLCLECQKSDKHLVITLPCGHRVLCVDCAKHRSSCPVCYRDIANVVVTYE